MKIGDLEVHILSDGRFRLDGGSMYGAVPRPRWEPFSPTDERHRIQMDLLCTLIKTPTARVLIDTGIGPDVTDQYRDVLALERSRSIVDQLADWGVAPDEVTHVVLTHLHFDHVGGSGLFPKARYVIQKKEWDAAHSDHPKARAGYPRKPLEPLHHAPRLDLVDGEKEIVPHVRVLPTGGHTWGHQVVLAESSDGGILCWGDLLPLVPYVRPLWVCGYDVDPEGSVTQKLRLARLAAEREWRVVTSHDPNLKIGVIRAEAKPGAFRMEAV
ncbi:MAG TPA: MBL fold metallo-hydrolase [Candidatus Xenobia bacterium]